MGGQLRLKRERLREELSMKSFMLVVSIKPNKRNCDIKSESWIFFIFVKVGVNDVQISLICLERLFRIGLMLRL